MGIVEQYFGVGGIVCIAAGICLWIWVRDDLPELLKYLRLRKMINNKKETK